MIILPAIDLKDGVPVRLYQGEFATAHRVAESAVLMAKRFEAEGARWIHIVDLDGARDGTPKNHGIIEEIANATGLLIECGGGVRSMETVERLFSAGVRRVVLGSAALHSPALVREAVSRYGDGVAVGIDAKNRMVATQGWTEESNVDFIEMAKRMEAEGVGTLIFTDIAKDGMLLGPNLELLDELRLAVSCRVIASGGIRDRNDLQAIAALGIWGAICGKSIYAGTLTVRDAVATGGDQHE